VATAIAMVVSTCLTLLILYRQSRIQPFTPGYVKPIFSSIAIGMVIYGVAKSLPFYYWMLPIYLVLFLGGYAFSLLVTGSLDREDIAMFETVSEKTGMKMRLIRKLARRFARD
jgi:O-antigen/teichoic acid export membrane protein